MITGTYPNHLRPPYGDKNWILPLEKNEWSSVVEFQLETPKRGTETGDWIAVRTPCLTSTLHQKSLQDIHSSVRLSSSINSVSGVWIILKRR